MYTHLQQVYVKGSPFYTSSYFIHSYEGKKDSYYLQDINGNVLTYISDGLEYAQPFEKDEIITLSEKLLEQYKENYGKQSY